MNLFTAIPPATLAAASFAAGSTVRIDLPGGGAGGAGRGYDIVIGDNILSEAGSLIAAKLGVRRCLIVTDSTVGPLYAARLAALLAGAGHQVLSTLTVKAGEASKDFATLQNLLEQMLAAGLDRKALVIALGGGVVGDLAGCAAALALRGIDYVQVPTTLLAQVDSAVGGKTGINTAVGKNTVGVFCQPRLVLADMALLDSLPPREMRAGYAEVVKYGIIGDRPFFDWCCVHGAQLLAGDRAAQIRAVEASCSHKARIVAADEYESGARALLNFGHTFAHALETVLGYNGTLLHGEAVAIGMVLACRLSAQLGLCPHADVYDLRDHLKALQLPVIPPAHPYDIDRLMALMVQDKKAVGGKLTLILCRGIGQAFIAPDVDAREVRAVWDAELAGQ